MAKTKQTEKLSRAQFEFMQRNPEKKKAHSEETAHLEPIHNFLNEIKQSDEQPTESFEDFLKKNYCRPAARQSTAVRQFRLETEDWKEKSLQNAGAVVQELFSGDAENTLIVSIDLTRSKEAILQEVADLITKAKEDVQETRLKWLPVVDEFLEVWDLRSEGMSFSEISRSKKITIDLARKRFYRAYQLISGEDYDKNLWKNLLRQNIERLAKTEKRLDKKFWQRVMKLESLPQIDKNPKLKEDKNGNKKPIFDDVGHDDNYDLKIIIFDLKKLCLKCPDASCRAETLQCLTEYEAGGMNAFTDFKPDCPKFYDYLKH